MRIFKIASVFVVLLFLIAVCGKEEATSPTPRIFPEELVGTWDYQSVTIDGIDAVLRLILDWQEETVRATLSISSDGSFVNSEYSADDSVMWFEDGNLAVNSNNFTITFYNNSNGVISPPEIQSGTWEVSGNQLTLFLNLNEIIAAIITTRQN